MKPAGSSYLGAVAALLMTAACAPAMAPSTTAVLAPAPPNVKPQDVLDHFVCYGIQERKFAGPQNLAVIDQYYVSPPGPVVVTDRRYLCNPVDKTRQGAPPERAKHRPSHLVCYGLRAVKLAGVIQVSNQFDDDGPQEATLIDSDVLCLPSGKAADGAPLPPIPKDLDHFKCYGIDANVSGTERLRVHDQFVDTEATLFLQPLVLCNPAEKVINGEQQGPMLHNFAHLVCYSIDFDSDMDLKKVLITNQFEPKGTVVSVWHERFLCVPSTKANKSL